MGFRVYFIIFQAHTPLLGSDFRSMSVFFYLLLLIHPSYHDSRDLIRGSVNLPDIVEVIPFRIKHLDDSCHFCISILSDRANARRRIC